MDHHHHERVPIYALHLPSYALNDTASLRSFLYDVVHVQILPPARIQLKVATALLAACFVVLTIVPTAIHWRRDRKNKGMINFNDRPTLTCGLAGIFVVHYFAFTWSTFNTRSARELGTLLLPIHWMWALCATWLWAIDPLISFRKLCLISQQPALGARRCVKEIAQNIVLYAVVPCGLLASAVAINVPLLKTYRSRYQAWLDFDATLAAIQYLPETPALSFQQNAAAWQWQDWTDVWWLVGVARWVWSAWAIAFCCAFIIAGIRLAYMLDKLPAGSRGESSNQWVKRTDLVPNAGAELTELPSRQLAKVSWHTVDTTVDSGRFDDHNSQAHIYPPTVEEFHASGIHIRHLFRPAIELALHRIICVTGPMIALAVAMAFYGSRAWLAGVNGPEELNRLVSTMSVTFAWTMLFQGVLVLVHVWCFRRHSYNEL